MDIEEDTSYNNNPPIDQFNVEIGKYFKKFKLNNSPIPFDKKNK